MAQWARTIWAKRWGVTLQLGMSASTATKLFLSDNIASNLGTAVISLDLVSVAALMGMAQDKGYFLGRPGTEQKPSIGRVMEERIAGATAKLVAVDHAIGAEPPDQHGDELRADSLCAHLQCHL